MTLVIVWLFRQARSIFDDTSLLHYTLVDLTRTKSFKMSSIGVVRPLLQGAVRSQRRMMSSSVRLAAEGSTGSGSSRPGGAAAG